VSPSSLLDGATTTPRSPARGCRGGGAPPSASRQPPSAASEAMDGGVLRQPDLFCSETICTGNRTPACSSTRSTSRGSRPSVHGPPQRSRAPLLPPPLPRVRGGGGHIISLRSALGAGIRILGAPSRSAGCKLFPSVDITGHRGAGESLIRK
jgi:hypothetical protein